MYCIQCIHTHTHAQKVMRKKKIFIPLQIFTYVYSRNEVVQKKRNKNEWKEQVYVFCALI